MNERARVFHALTLTAYATLLVLLVSQYAWLAPPAQVPAALALVLALAPLLVPVLGLLRASPYTHAWTSFLALPYFALGVDTLAAGVAADWLGWGVVCASLGLFVGAVGFARHGGRALQRAADS